MARIIVRLEVTPQTKKCPNRAYQTSRMKQLKMISRLIEWFGNQSQDREIEYAADIIGERYYPPLVQGGR
jgi:hypothetical protein